MNDGPLVQKLKRIMRGEERKAMTTLSSRIIEQARWLPGERFWRYAVSLSCMACPIDHAGFEEAFRRHRASWTPDCMRGVERALYDALPPVLTIWRSQPRTLPLGLRWTDERGIALRFGKGPQRRLFERRIPKSDIAFVTGGGDLVPEIFLFEPPA